MNFSHISRLRLLHVSSKPFLDLALCCWPEIILINLLIFRQETNIPNFLLKAQPDDNVSHSSAFLGNCRNRSGKHFVAITFVVGAVSLDVLQKIHHCLGILLNAVL